MFRTDNRRLFWRLAYRSIRDSRGRHLLIAMAVCLSAVMLFSIFTIGMSYLRNLDIMMERIDGVADAYLYAPTQEQYQLIQNTSGVERVGLEVYVGSESISAVSGGAVPLEHWYYDKEAWTFHILPTVSDAHGTYPQEKNEIMLSVSTLNKLGIERPETGMDIQLTSRYILSGWFTDYTSEDRVIRSEQAAQDLTAGFFGTEGSRLGVSWSSEQVWESLQEIPLGEEQRWQQNFQRSIPGEPAVYLVLGIAAGLVLAGGYLFVNNILSLSVRHDIRFYGMLKTLGAAPRQLRRLIQAKACLAALTGLPPGLLISMVFCLNLVPRALNALANENMTAMPRTVAFSPAIFLGTLLFVGLTISLSCWKPARLAGKISPMQALAYTGMPEGRRRGTGRRSGRATLFRMAFHNVFRQKKQAARVFASLVLGSVLILTVNSVFHLQAPDYNANGYDITLETHLVFPNNTSENQPVMEAITQLDGIETMWVLQKTDIYVLSQPPVFLPYLELSCWYFYDDSDRLADLREEYLASAGTFDRVDAFTLESSVVERYNQSAEHPIDLAAFEAGRTVILYDMYSAELAEPVDLSGLVGQEVSLRAPNGSLLTFEIGGILEEADCRITGVANTPSTPPLLLSDTAMERINPEAGIVQIDLNAEEGRLSELDAAIQELLATAPEEIRYYSTAQTQASYESDKRTLALIGNGVCILMILMGFLNYVNVMVTSVQTRRRELAMMESLGMTQRQLRSMLVWEGGIYAGLSVCMFLAVGVIMLAVLSGTSFQAETFSFSFVWPLRLVAGLVLDLLVLCPCISAAAYQSTLRVPIIQRLKETG